MEREPSRASAMRLFRRAALLVLTVFAATALASCYAIVPILGYRLDADGGVLCSPATGRYDAAGLKEIAVPCRDGYRFAGWRQIGPDPEGVIRLTAQWEPLCFEVVFDPAGGAADDPALLLQTVACGEDAQAPEVSRDGYAFLGWDRAFADVREPILVTARWKPAGTLTIDEIREACMPACLYLQTYASSGIPICFGSAFLISPDGYAVTAAHVIRGAARITAQFADGKQVEVRSVHAFEDDRDIAILKLDGDSFPYLESSPEMPAVGDTVYAIGAPAGQKWSVDEGTVQRLTYLYDTTGMIATTLPIKGGSSGGPLIDSRGYVVGMNAAFSVIENAALSVSNDLFDGLIEVDMELPAFADAYAGWLGICDEGEPNADTNEATPLYVNAFANGVLSGAGDEDWFRCDAEDGRKKILYFVAVPVAYRNVIRARVTDRNGTVLAEGLSSYTSGITGMSVFLISAYAAEGDPVCLRLTTDPGYRDPVPYTIRVIYA